MLLKKQKLIIFFALTVVFSFFVFSNLVLAQTPDLGTEYAGQIGLGSQDIRTTIASIIRTALGLLGIVVVSLMIYAGYLWMTAGGDEDKVAQSKKILLNSVIGLAIILSAYAITSFIISKLSSATTAVPMHCTNQQVDLDLGEIDVDCGGECGECLEACVGPDCVNTFSRNFGINSLFNGGGVCIRNFHPTITFTQGVKMETVSTDIFYLTKDSDQAKNVVLGKWQVVAGRNNIIEFIPDGDCGGGKTGCLEAETNYTFNIKTDEVGRVKSVSDMSLSCAFKLENCNPILFKTGTNVDEKDPTVIIQSPSGDLERGAVVPVILDYDDENGVQSISVFDNDRYIDTVRPEMGHNCDIKGTLRASWKTIEAPLGLNTLRASAMDWAGRMGSGESVVDLRGSGCYAVPPVGNCGNPDGERCAKDADCFSGYCNPQTNLCEAKMKITGFGPKSGAPGTFVTLAGRYFGIIAGHVYFASTTKAQPDVNIPADWVEASLPVNCGGASVWTDSQITVVVPAGGTKGPIKVVTAVVGGKTSHDLTNDNFGPNLGIFALNNEVHPKLCEVVPNQGKIGDAVVLSGKDFYVGATHVFNVQEDQVLFGTVAATISRTVPITPDWTREVIKTTVPGGLAVGRFATKVTARINNVLQDSNTLIFTVTPGENSTLPFIDGVSPERGSAGEYITITGKNFGATVGTVWFKLNGEGQAVFGDVLSFPKGCNIPLWSDNKILVKFPAGQVVGDYTVQVKPASANVPVSSMYPRRFKLELGTPAPGICKLEPADIPKADLAKNKVTITGEYFQTESLGPTNGLVFYHTFDASDVVNGTSMDKSGNNYNGKVSNGNIVAGQIGSAMSFVRNTSGQVLFDLPLNNKLEFPDTDFAVSLWYKSNFTQVNDNTNIITRTGSGGKSFWTFKKFKGGGGISFQLYDEKQVLSQTPVAVGGIVILDNNWHNLVGVVDRVNKEARTYVDGRLGAKSSIAALGKIITSVSAPKLFIDSGVVTNDESTIDDVRIYNRTLSAGEVDDLYKIGSGQKPRVTDVAPLEVYFSKAGSTAGRVATMAKTLAGVSEPLNPGQKVSVAPHADTISGAVVVRRPGDLKISNSLQFGAVSCLEKNKTCTNAREKCCADGICRDKCQGEKLYAGYVWRFSTRDILSVPRVVEECSVEANRNGNALIPSPSPSTMWNVISNNAHDNVCRTALITVKFNTALKADTITNGNVFVRECGGGIENKVCKAPGASLPLTAESYILKVASSNRENIPNHYLSLQLGAGQQWEQGKTYQVVLTRGIKNDTEKLLELATDKPCDAANSAYCFSFTAGGEICKLQSLVITPERFLTTTLTGDSGPIKHKEGGVMTDLQYRGLGQSTQSCVLMSMDGFSWKWRILANGTDANPHGTLNNTYAKIFGNDTEASSKVSSLENTFGVAGLDRPEDAVNVEGEASLDPQVVSATSPLTIDLTNPEVVDFWPKCEEACMNAEVGVKFNMNMSRKNLPGAAVNGAVRLFKCDDVNCLRPTAVSLTDIQSPNEAEGYSVIKLVNGGDVATVLEADTWYEVRISTSTPGVQQVWSLKSVNSLDLGGKPYAKEKSWRFKTKKTTCLIDRLGVAPEEYIAEGVTDKVIYKGEAFSAPDNCSTKGQKLNARSVGWSWASKGRDMSSSGASVAIVHEFKTTKVLNGNCTGFCTRKGSNLPVGTRTAVCGNGVVEAGEDCDVPLKNNGRIYCSLNCLKIGTDVPLCGNGQLDDGEECDPKIQPIGCTDKCLHSGSLSKDKVLPTDLNTSICGDGKVTLGEDCDSGIPSQLDVWDSAIGCATNCLHQGTPLGAGFCKDASDGHYGFDGTDRNTENFKTACAKALSQCGDRFANDNEDPFCEDKNHSFGQVSPGCNNFCLKTTGECESGVEGCNSNGTLRGSSIFYTRPSICGDGVVGIGEDSFCENDLIDISSGDPKVLVEGVGQGVVDNSTPPKQQANIVATVTDAQKVKNNTATGFGKFIIPCGYTTDQKCREVTGNPDSVVGANSCCYTRPKLVSVYPATTTQAGKIFSDICPNTYLEAVFDQPIDEKTLAGNFVIARGFVGGNDAYLDLDAETFSAMQVVDNILYAVSDDRFWVVDIVNPEKPSVLKRMVGGDGGGAVLTGASALYVDKEAKIAYIGGSNQLEILNVADPANPRHISTLKDGERRPGIKNSGDGGLIKIVGVNSISPGVLPGSNTKVIFLTSGYNVAVVDVSISNRPIHIGSWNKVGARNAGESLWEAYQVGANSFISALILDDHLDITTFNMDGGRLIFTAQSRVELPSSSGMGVQGNLVYVESQQKLHIVDLADPTKPVVLGNVDLGIDQDLSQGRLKTTKVFVEGKYAFVAGFKQISMVDITDPAKPVLKRVFRESSNLPEDGRPLFGNVSSVSKVGDYLIVSSNGDINYQTRFIYLPGFTCSGSEDVTNLVAVEARDSVQLAWYEKAWYGFVNFFKKILGQEAVAEGARFKKDLVANKWCAGEDLGIAKVVNDPVLKLSRIVVDLKDTLKGSTEYAIILKDGIKDTRGISIGGQNGKSINWKFATVKDVCEVDKITVNPTEYLFETAQKEIDLQTQVFSNTGQTVQATVSYDWNYVWSPINNGIVSWLPTSEAFNSVTSGNVNGEAVIRVSANVILAPAGEKIGRVATAESKLTVNLCENDWPPKSKEIGGVFRTIWPYEDKAGNNDYFDLITTKDFTNASAVDARGDYFNFSTSYCADDGSNNNIYDDLPYLRPAIQTGAGALGVLEKSLKRFIFTNDKNSDAIGIQVFPNLQHLSLREWYATQSLGGNLGTTNVAGYEALADNNNIYIDAVNVAGGVPYTNVYLFSINADAKPETRQVFAQMIKNLKFNINVNNKRYCSGNSEISCQTDFDCPTNQICYALVDKMKRNFQRLRGLNTIKMSMDAYAEGHNSAYPALTEGSLLPGQSISTWPSWSAALANDIGRVLPKDPIDRLGVAGTCTAPAGKIIYCLSDDDCTVYDPATCNFHDATTGWTTFDRRFSFACAIDSLAYRYIYDSINKNYEVRAKMEKTASYCSDGRNTLTEAVCNDETKRCVGAGVKNNTVCNADSECTSLAKVAGALTANAEYCSFFTGNDDTGADFGLCVEGKPSSSLTNGVVNNVVLTSAINFGTCTRQSGTKYLCALASTGKLENQNFNISGQAVVDFARGGSCVLDPVTDGQYTCALDLLPSAGNSFRTPNDNAIEVKHLLISGVKINYFNGICKAGESYKYDFTADGEEGEISQAVWEGLARTAGPLFLDFDKGNFKLFEDSGICTSVGAVRRGEVLTISQGVCGDGVVQVGTEDCDPIGSIDYGTCNLEGNTKMNKRTCVAGCHWGAPAVVACSDLSRCGNAKVEAGEVCDDGLALNGKYNQCNADCKGRNTAGFCGNGRIDGPVANPFELCDVGTPKCISAGAKNGQNCTTSNECVEMGQVPVQEGLEAVAHYCYGIVEDEADEARFEACMADPKHLLAEDWNKVVVKITSGGSCVWQVDKKYRCSMTGSGKLYGIVNREMQGTALVDLGVGGNCVLSDGMYLCNVEFVPTSGNNFSNNIELAVVTGLSIKGVKISYIDGRCPNSPVIYGMVKAESCNWDCKTYGPYCGDGIVQSEFGEECDKADAEGSKCSVGAVTGKFGCKSNCKRDNAIAVYWWRFNRTLSNGNTTNDSSYIKPTNGTYNYLSCSGDNCPNIEAGKISQSAYFDGVNDFMKITGQDDIGLLSSPQFSIEAWVRLEDKGARETSTIVSKGDESRDAYSLYYDYSAKQFSFMVNDGVGDRGAKSRVVELGGWTYVVATNDGQRSKLYIDGQLSGEYDAVPQQNNNDFYVGVNSLVGGTPSARSYVGYFKGKIDELAYYNRVLTPEEIKSNFEKDGYFCSTTVAIASIAVDPNKPRCGDGKVDQGEACDTGDGQIGQACTATYDKSCTYCAVGCGNVVEVKPTQYCGDGVIQVDKGELCEFFSTNNSISIWSASINNFTGGSVSKSDDHNGYPVQTCEGASVGLIGAYKIGNRSCDTNCTRLVDGCIQCGLMAQDKGGVSVTSKIINTLNPADANSNPLRVDLNGNLSNALRIYPKSSFLPNSPMAFSKFSIPDIRSASFTTTMNGGVTAYFNSNNVCKANNDQTYKMVINNDVARAFTFPISASPAPGLYDLVVSPIMYNNAEKDNIRVVAVWFGEINHKNLTDATGFVRNQFVGGIIGGNREIIEGTSISKVVADNYYSAEGAFVDNTRELFGVVRGKTGGIWSHGSSNSVGATYIESYTINTNALTTDIAFYVRSNSAIDIRKGYLKVEVYLPENDADSRHFSRPSATYYLSNAQASDNSNAGYWHVLNVKKSADIPNVRDRLVEINQVRTSPQFFEFR